MGVDVEIVNLTRKQYVTLSSRYNSFASGDYPGCEESRKQLAALLTGPWQFDHVIVESDAGSRDVDEWEDVDIQDLLATWTDPWGEGQ